MMKRTRSAAGLVVTIGLLAACGGGGGGSDTADDDDVVTTSPAETTPATDPPATEPAVTDPPATDPPATDPPATDPPATDPPATDPAESGLPDWASGTIVTVESDTGPIELPVEIVPFCESSRSFYVAANALEDVSGGQVGTGRQLFAALVALAPLTIETAPSDELAVKPTAARDHLAVITPALEEIGYDSSRTAELSDPQAFFDAFEGLAEIRDGLRSFLLEACGADGDVLDEQSRNAAALAAEAAGETVVPDEPVAGSPLTNAASTITVSVPADWMQTDESVVNERDLFVASSDIGSFSELTAPGVAILRGEGGFRDGGFAGRVLEFESDLADLGCALVFKGDYDDGVYSGQEGTYDCGTDGLDVRLLGGTTADESLYALVLLVHSSDEPGVRQLIVDTFEVA